LGVPARPWALTLPFNSQDIGTSRWQLAMNVTPIFHASERGQSAIGALGASPLGAGAVVAVCRGSIACPVVAVKDWLAAANIIEGPVFRRAGKGGKLTASRLTPQSVALINAARLRLDPGAFSGHVTSAAARGFQGEGREPAQVSRHAPGLCARRGRLPGSRGGGATVVISEARYQRKSGRAGREDRWR
jgi:hypothetical protein